METVNKTSAVTPRCIPWNKGKLIGPALVHASDCGRIQSPGLEVRQPAV
jgi:hypothetical protein